MRYKNAALVGRAFDQNTHRHPLPWKGQTDGHPRTLLVTPVTSRVRMLEKPTICGFVNLPSVLDPINLLLSLASRSSDCYERNTIQVSAIIGPYHKILYTAIHGNVMYNSRRNCGINHVFISMG